MSRVSWCRRSNAGSERSRGRRCFCRSCQHVTSSPKDFTESSFGAQAPGASAFPAPTRFVWNGPADAYTSHSRFLGPEAVRAFPAAKPRREGVHGPKPSHDWTYSSDQSERCVVRRGGHHARAGCTSWRPPPAPTGAIPYLVDETLERTRSRHDRAGRRRRHRHSHRQRAARLRDRPARRASAAPGWSSAASTRRCFPTKRTSTAARTRSSRATATSVWARVVADCFAGTPCRVYDGGTVSASDSSAPAGTCCRRALHVGVGADRARLPEALLVLLGLADGRPGAAAARRRSRRAGNRRAAAAGLPVHRARRRQLLSGHARRPRAAGAPVGSRRGCGSCRRCGRSDSS